jgi:DNA integrity scanning protein DisA with diadenylate cyclase activity
LRLDPAFLAARRGNPQVLEALVAIGTELAREGREGRKIGALFTLGDHEAVLSRSRPMILDPLAGHPASAKRIEVASVRETLKELAQLDGAFVVSNEGVAVAACRYLWASADGIDLPLGLGSRHLAAAAMTRVTESVAVVVSESSTLRIFDRGRVVLELLPDVAFRARQPESETTET